MKGLPARLQLVESRQPLPLITKTTPGFPVKAGGVSSRLFPGYFLGMQVYTKKLLVFSRKERKKEGGAKQMCFMNRTDCSSPGGSGSAPGL